MKNAKRPVVLIGGVSGSGVTTALTALEDWGYETFSLPLYAVPDLLRHHKTPQKALAIRVDVAGLKMAEQKNFLNRISSSRGNNVRIFFLDCSDHELAQRYVQTRRRHPLGLKPSADNLFAAERRQLKILRQAAEIEIDTTGMAAKRLRQIVKGHFALEGQKSGLRVDVISFAVPLGLPLEANSVTDMRFLNNPHYVPRLQKHTGQNRAVGRYIMNDPDFRAFFRLETARLDLMLSRLREEGLNYYVLAYGCTGGKHRSVFMAEAIAAWLKHEIKLDSVMVYHRELEGK